MSEKKRQEFISKVEDVVKATREYAEGRERGDWFERGLDDQLRNSVDALLRWGLTVRPLTPEEAVECSLAKSA